MNGTAIAERPGTSDARSTRHWSLPHVAVAVLLFLGVAVLVYPTAASWFSDVNHAGEVSGYATMVRDAPDAELAGILARARTYNENLPNGPLRDPYTLNASGASVSLEEGRDEYVGQLSIGTQQAMARIRIPEIDVDLPIFHGTAEAELERGIGHLYGSGLPVGGSGVHAVLAGHSGLPSATLFTRLDELEVGDLFFLDVAGETLAYRVDQTTVVLPDDGDDLRRTPGRDQVTLLTCTPTGVNSHRLLVRGERVDSGQEQEAVQQLEQAPTGIPLPWWIGALVAGLGVAAVVARPRRAAAPVAPARSD